MSRFLLFTFVAYFGYATGSLIRGNVDAVITPMPEAPITLDGVNINNLEIPAIVALQGIGAGSPPRQCAGIGQSCSAHGDCCTSSCFGVLRTCIPNLGIALNIQIGRADEVSSSN